MLRATVAWFLAPAVLAIALPAQVEEADKLDAVKEFKKYFRSYKGVATSQTG